MSRAAGRRVAERLLVEISLGARGGVSADGVLPAHFVRRQDDIVIGLRITPVLANKPGCWSASYREAARRNFPGRSGWRER